MEAKKKVMQLKKLWKMILYLHHCLHKKNTCRRGKSSRSLYNQLLIPRQKQENHAVKIAARDSLAGIAVLADQRPAINHRDVLAKSPSFYPR
jgi:hypothetical protein